MNFLLWKALEGGFMVGFEERDAGKYLAVSAAEGPGPIPTRSLSTRK